MLKNLKRAAAIVLSFAMAIQFGLANSYYVNAEEEPVEPQQEQTTTVENNNELQEEETNEVAAPETKSVELSYVAEDGTILQAATYRDFDLNYSLNADSSVMLNFGLAQEGQRHAVAAQRRLDDVGDVVLIGLAVEVLQALAGGFLMAGHERDISLHVRGDDLCG